MYKLQTTFVFAFQTALYTTVHLNDSLLKTLRLKPLHLQHFDPSQLKLYTIHIHICMCAHTHPPPHTHTQKNQCYRYKERNFFHTKKRRGGGRREEMTSKRTKLCWVARKQELKAHTHTHIHTQTHLPAVRLYSTDQISHHAGVRAHTDSGL